MISILVPRVESDETNNWPKNGWFMGKKACEAAKFIGNIELLLRFWAKSGANKLEQQPNLLIFS